MILRWSYSPFLNVLIIERSNTEERHTMLLISMVLKGLNKLHTIHQNSQGTFVEGWLVRSDGS